jgi:hypothetical protein
MKKILLSIFLLSFPMVMCAYNVVIDGIYYNLKPGNEAEVTYKDTNYNTYSGKVTIPEEFTYDGVVYSVTNIGKSTFRNSKELTSVYIPNSVTTIEENAFYGCKSLTTMTVPYSVTNIGSKAFVGCGSLSSVHITDLKAWCNIDFSDARANPLLIAHHLFLNGEEVKDLVIPQSVTCIKNHTFRSTSLTSVTFPSSLTSIGDRSFADCNSLTSVTIPNSVTSIGEGAFDGCDGITVVNITDLEKWCKISFNGNAFSSEGHYLYLNGKKITELVIPNTVDKVGNYAFSYCYGFTSVFIPGTITSIGDGAFNKCYGFTSLTIPNSVTNIGFNAFNGCKSLTSLTIGNSVNLIGNGAFQDCISLTSIIIPNSVTEIDDYAFSGCTGLTSIEIPNSVSYIGDFAFDNCNCYNVEDGIKYIGPYLLGVEDNTQSSYSIKEGTRTIGSSAFQDCSNLISVTIPNSVTYIGWQAFAGRSGLTSLTIPNSVKKIGVRAFSGCSGLVSVSFPNSLNSIDYDAFFGCGGLTSVISNMEDPCSINSQCFDEDVFKNSTLYVPRGTTAKYKSTDYWSKFFLIQERESTGIDNVTTSEDGNTLIYNLKGARMSEPQKGINIINGKKYVK